MSDVLRPRRWEQMKVAERKKWRKALDLSVDLTRVLNDVQAFVRTYYPERPSSRLMLQVQELADNLCSWLYVLDRNMLEEEAERAADPWMGKP